MPMRLRALRLISISRTRSGGGSRFGANPAGCMCRSLAMKKHSSGSRPALQFLPAHGHVAERLDLQAAFLNQGFEQSAQTHLVLFVFG